MPIAIPKGQMLSPDEIIRTALREHDQHGSNFNSPEVISTALRSLEIPGSIPFYSPSTSPLSVCRFRCMLQDTGYPLEVYLPPSSGSADSEDVNEEVDWSRLKERWVGWAVECPGEQEWVKKAVETTVDLSLDGLTLEGQSALPMEVASKFPLSNDGKYVGALLKVYDPSVSYRPGTAYTFTGILSASPLPTSTDEMIDSYPSTSNFDTVPVIHVLSAPVEAYPLSSYVISPGTNDEATREEVIEYLSQAFVPTDKVAAEVLLLSLISAVTSRLPGGIPLGNLSLNLLLPKASTPGHQIYDRLNSILAPILPLLVSLPLSLNLLSTQSFYPISSASSLQSGLLQLPPSSMLLLNEDTLEAGTLGDKGVRNLKALAECVQTQKLKYEFPYVDEGFGMDVDLGCVVVGTGKTLLPVDLHFPVLANSAAEASPLDIPAAKLDAFRRFILAARESAKSLAIPDDVAEQIQTDWVKMRKEGWAGKKVDLGEDDLKRWMRVGRLLAISYPAKSFTVAVWKRTLEIDLERRERMSRR